MEAAIMGLGITRLLSYQIEPQLKSGKLHTILPDEQAPELPINIVHREGRYASAKVRSFVDLMAERLKSDPALHSID
jgi:DNA-binding transcriptional LysR family regulator